MITSKDLSIAVAKTSASSLLEKLRPYTCLLSRHWWNVGVAWLYLRPFKMAQFMTTWNSLIKKLQDSIRIWIGLILEYAKQNIYVCIIMIYLMILKFPSNNSESIVEKMMVNVNLWQSMRWSWGNPFFVEIIVYHNRSSSRGNALLRAFVTKMEKFYWYQLKIGYVL